MNGKLMENINSPFIFRFTVGLPIIRAGEEYFVMPQKLQVLITNEMKTRAIPDVDTKFSNYFTHARVDQLRMALVRYFEWNFNGIFSYPVHNPGYAVPTGVQGPGGEVDTPP